MRYFALLFFLLFNACKPKTDNKISSISSLNTNLDWLIGSWQRLDEEEGKSTFEFWHKVNENLYEASSYTLQGVDTTWSEFVKFGYINDQWQFEVLGKGDIHPTIFKLVDQSDSSFTVENNTIDFPQRIYYVKSGSKIKASVSNDEVTIPFEFEKTQSLHK